MRRRWSNLELERERTLGRLAISHGTTKIIRIEVLGIFSFTMFPLSREANNFGGESGAESYFVYDEINKVFFCPYCRVFPENVRSIGSAYPFAPNMKLVRDHYVTCTGLQNSMHPSFFALKPTVPHTRYPTNSLTKSGLKSSTCAKRSREGQFSANNVSSQRFLSPDSPRSKYGSPQNENELASFRFCGASQQAMHSQEAPFLAGPLDYQRDFSPISSPMLDGSHQSESWSLATPLDNQHVVSPGSLPTENESHQGKPRSIATPVDVQHDLSPVPLVTMKAYKKNGKRSRKPRSLATSVDNQRDLSIVPPMAGNGSHRNVKYSLKKPSLVTSVVHERILPPVSVMKEKVSPQNVDTSTFTYTVLLPKTYEGFMLNLSETRDKAIKFEGFWCHRNGDKPYAERQNLIRNIGDIIVAVNGHSVSGKTKREIVDTINCAEVSVTLCLIDVAKRTQSENIGGKLDKCEVSDFHFPSNADGWDAYDTSKVRF